MEFYWRRLRNKNRTKNNSHHFWLISVDFWAFAGVCVSVKTLNHLRRLMNKFNFNNDFLVLSLNVSLLCSTTAWGILVCIVASFDRVYLLFSALIAAGVRKKFIISASCKERVKWTVHPFMSQFIFPQVESFSGEHIFFFFHFGESFLAKFTNNVTIVMLNVMKIKTTARHASWDCLNYFVKGNSLHICSLCSIHKLCSGGKLCHFP